MKLRGIFVFERRIFPPVRVPPLRTGSKLDVDNVVCDDGEAPGGEEGVGAVAPVQVGVAGVRGVHGHPRVPQHCLHTRRRHRDRLV